MKKFFFALCALIVGMAANAEEYYLCGNGIGWEASETNHFKPAEDGIYVLDFNGTLHSGFKINNGSWETGVNYGSNGNKLELGKAYSMQSKGGDIAVESSIANPHCVLDVKNWTLTITTTSGPVESKISYAIHGQIFGDTNWSTTEMKEAEDGTWTLTANVVAGKFGIKKLDNGTQIAWITSAGEAAVSINTPMSAIVDGTNWSSTLAGEYTFVFNPEAMTLTIQGEAPVGPDPVDPVYTYGLHGSVFTGKWETRPMTEEEDGTWTLTATLQAGEFGIQKLDAEGKQVEWISAANGLTEAVVNIAMGASTSGSNWVSALAGEYTFVFNPTAMTLTIKGETPVGPDPVDPKLPEHVYIVGHLASGKWDIANAPELTFDEDTKLFSIKNIEIVGYSEEATIGYFSFITKRGSDWDTEVNTSDRYGAPTENAQLTVPSTTNVTLFKASENASAAYSWEVEAGFYDIVLDLAKMTINITTNVSSAADIELGNEEAPVYFNLQGVQVAEPAAGLYIEVRGNQVRKVMIK